MKKAIAITTIILLALNLLAGLLFSGFKPFNIACTSATIVVTGVFIYLLNIVKMKDAYIISLSFFFAFLGFLEYILGLVSPPRFNNNYLLFADILLVVMELLIMIICSIVSKKV